MSEGSTGTMMAPAARVRSARSCGTTAAGVSTIRRSHSMGTRIAKLRVTRRLRSYPAMPWTGASPRGRLLSQRELEACASMSISAGLNPCVAKYAARLVAMVVLPEPPFGLSTTIFCSMGRNRSLKLVLTVPVEPEISCDENHGPHADMSQPWDLGRHAEVLAFAAAIWPAE